MFFDVVDYFHLFNIYTTVNSLENSFIIKIDLSLNINELLYDNKTQEKLQLENAQNGESAGNIKEPESSLKEMKKTVSLT